MAKIKDIGEAYDFFLLRFSQICVNGNYPVRYSGFAPKFIRVESPPFDRIGVHGMVYLKDWPYKVVTRQKKIDILVSGTEHFDSGGGECIYSNVHVNYLTVTPKGTARVIENIHYDFDANPEAAHPLFHAQFANNEVGDEARRLTVGFDYGIDSREHHPRYKNVRVPTAHMNLPSVLLCLAADHLRSTFFLELIGEVRQNNPRLPEASCQRMRQSFAGGRDFCKSVHWY